MIFPTGISASMALRKRMNSWWWWWLCMHCPMTLPSSTSSSSRSGLQRQARPRPVECLDLALLVDAEHDGVSGRVDIEPDDVPELRHELRIARQLELPRSVRLKPVRPP